MNNRVRKGMGPAALLRPEKHPRSGSLRATAGIFSISLFLILLLLQGCKKDKDIDDKNAGALAAMSKKPPKNPPPPPPAFYFSDCGIPTYAAGFKAGVPVNMTITKSYVNSPGGNYAAFTSPTVNGITITAPAGTFTSGSGSVTFTVTGTPVSTGYYHMHVSVGNIQPCLLYLYVSNPPVSGPNADPGPTEGSTGIVNFTYRGQPVAYKTVRTANGKIWLQQNLGSPQVAFSEHDISSFGDYFQWGRWDDGHQVKTSPMITGGSALMNPSHIPSGHPSFITGTTSTTRWWGVGGLSSDTWSGNPVSATNGKDPCTALGPGWRMPTAADWMSLMPGEDLEGTMAAYQSNLKLTAAGNRSYANGDAGYYWTSTADGVNAKLFFMDNNTYSAGVSSSYRAEGLPCRCMKD